jgi:putative NADH-flavin reductase
MDTPKMSIEKQRMLEKKAAKQQKKEALKEIEKNKKTNETFLSNKQKITSHGPRVEKYKNKTTTAKVHRVVSAGH